MFHVIRLVDFMRGINTFAELQLRKIYTAASRVVRVEPPTQRNTTKPATCIVAIFE